jgi:ribosomal-protein-alanine N-acetyltransferase
VAARHPIELSPAGLLRRLGLARAPAVTAGFGRVRLYPFRPANWDEWAALRGASRPFLAAWESTWPEDALSAAAFRKRVRQYAEDWDRGSGYHFLIRRAGDDLLVGGINLTNVRRGIAQNASLGYWIGAEFSRQGYMTEAMNAILGFAFADMKLNRIEAACLPDNAASRALLAKCGFKEEGRARKYLRINGMWQDHLTFAILHEDWEAARLRPRDPARWP